MADFLFNTGNETVAVHATATDNGYQFQIGERLYQVQTTQSGDGQLKLIVDGIHHQVAVVAGRGNRAQERKVWFAGQTWMLEKVDADQPGQHGTAVQVDGLLTAAMPGQVRELLVVQGDTVVAGTPLAILEAMKMETRVTAPIDGTITAIHCTVGDVVERGQLLLEIDSHTAETG